MARDRIGEALEALAGETSRRGFLAASGRCPGGRHRRRAWSPRSSSPATPTPYTNFCGHTYTTGSCIHPLGLPRVDSRGLPIRPGDGRPVDNLGRLVNDEGLPIHDDGSLARDPGRAAAAARAADQDLQADRGGIRDRGPASGRLVPMLRGPGAQALGLLLAPRPTDQRRRRPARLLLRRPEGLLRHLLPDPRPMLSAQGGRRGR